MILEQNLPRPGSLPVNSETQLKRIVPIITTIKEKYPDQILSVDTQNTAVAKSIELGVTIINDISALRTDSEMAELLADNPQIKVSSYAYARDSTHNATQSFLYECDSRNPMTFFQERIDYCFNQEFCSNIILDPGIGFGKTLGII